MSATWPGARSNRTARGGGQLAERPHGLAGPDLAAQLAQVGRQRVGDGLRTALRRPASRRRARRPAARGRTRSSARGPSGRKAWAAQPARSARASSVLNAEPSGRRRRRQGREPEADQRQRMPGHPEERTGDHGRQLVPPLGHPADPSTVGAAVSSQRRRGLVDRSVQHGGSAAVERVGERDLGLEPPRGRGVRAAASTGTATRRPSGCTAEQTSWTNPGRVSSAERVPPPTVSAPSTTSTERPAWARVMAAARPLGPAPTTTASYGCSRPLSVGRPRPATSGAAAHRRPGLRSSDWSGLRQDASAGFLQGPADQDLGQVDPELHAGVEVSRRVGVGRGLLGRVSRRGAAGQRRR